MRFWAHFIQFSLGSTTQYFKRSKQCTIEQVLFYKPLSGIACEANPQAKNDVCEVSSAVTQFCGAVLCGSGEPISF